MKGKISLCVAAVLLCGPVHAGPFNEFDQRILGSLIKPMALDLGGLMGAVSFHTGQSLGVPGFSAQAKGAVQSTPDKNNLVLRNTGVKTFGIPVLELGVGLPFRIDVIAHGIKAEGISLFGGGLRYQIFKAGLITKFLPNVGVAAFGDVMTHDAFRARHFGLNAAASWDLPLVDPYVGAGYDATTLKVNSATTVGVTGLTASAVGSRFTAGVEATPFPFLRVDAAALLLHGIPGGHFSLGAKF